MWLILGILLVVTGIVLIFKSVMAAKNGIKIDAEFIEFAEENGTTYPKFKFTHDGTEYVLTSSTPKKPNKFDHSIGDLVTVIFEPKNTKYVDIAGDKTNLLYGIASIVLGAILVITSISI